MFYFIRVLQLQVSNMENTVMSLTDASTGDATLEIVSAFAIYLSDILILSMNF